MNEYNYYPIKNIKNKNKPFPIINKLKIYLDKSKKLLHSKKDNYHSNKSYLDNNIHINLNDSNKKYNNLSLNNSSDKYLINRNYKFKESRYFSQKKNLNNSCRISDYILKPYIKKNLIIHPYGMNSKTDRIKSNLDKSENNFNTNSCTDHTFYKTKTDNTNEENFYDINNLNETFKYNNYHHKYIKKDIKVLNNSLSNLFNIKKYFFLKNNYSYHNNTDFNLPEEKEKIPEKINTRKFNSNNALTRNQTIRKYQTQFVKTLILILENYYKINFIKIKYIFLDNLKKYRKNRKKVKSKINIRNRKIQLFYNQYKTEKKYSKNSKISKFNDLFSSNCINRREKDLILQIKENNIKSSFNKINNNELCKNRSELIKMKDIIERRKKSKRKNKSIEKGNKNNFTERKNISSQKKNINRIKDKINIYIKNKSNDNIKIYRKKNFLSDKPKEKIIIVKKIISKDKRINLNIKYIGCINFKNKKQFTNLKISNQFSLYLLKKELNKLYIIKKLENKYLNNSSINKSKIKDEKNLGLIKEEEEKSFKSDEEKLYSHDKF